MGQFAYVNPSNPKRRRRRKSTKHSTRRRRARNPSNPPRRRRRRSGRRRNPGGRRMFGGVGLDLKSIGFGVAGAVGVELGGAARAKFLPPHVMATPIRRILVQAALVVARAMLAEHLVGASAAQSLPIGGRIA